MTECKNCIKQDVCDRDVGHGYSVCPHYLSANVVEVLRCKDCKYFYQRKGHDNMSNNKENKVNNKTNNCWIYRVILDDERCLANNINLSKSYIGTIFFGIPLTRLGYGSTTVFELYEEKDGSNIYSKDNVPPIVKVPNETIKVMIPVKQIVHLLDN